MQIKRTAAGLAVLALALCATNALADGSPSGANKTALTFSITSATDSGAFTPVSGRTFHLVIPAGTMSAVCHLERQPDGTNWVPVTVVGTELYSFTLTGSGVSEDLYEAQTNVAWRLDCGTSLGSYTSGTVAGSFTQ